MIDHWLGRLLGAIDDAGLAGTTGVVLCTDHGHYLGEHDLFGKPAAPVYSELGRIPLLVRWPGRAPRDVDALTTSVDLHATIVDLFGATVDHPTHGVSLLPLLDGTATSVRELALFGYWGRHVGVTGRAPPLPAGLRRGEPAAVDVVEPVVHHAGPPAPRPPPAPAGPSGGPAHDAGHGRAGTVPTVRGGGPSPLLGAGADPSRLPALRHPVDPGEVEDRAGEPVEQVLLDGLAGALRSVEAPDELSPAWGSADGGRSGGTPG